jgi:hypothetical protein
MKKTHKFSRLVELTSTQLAELTDSKEVIVYQAEYIRFSNSVGQSLFLVELQWKGA